MDRRGFIRGMIGLGVMAAVPFTWATKKARKVFTGARARLFINGKEVFYAQDVSFTINDKISQLPVMTIEPYEPVNMHVTMTCKSCSSSPEAEKFMRALLGDDDET